MMRAAHMSKSSKTNKTNNVKAETENGKNSEMQKSLEKLKKSSNKTSEEVFTKTGMKNNLFLTEKVNIIEINYTIIFLCYK
jgi:hypothetical protein